jgi:hypothetical protein
MVEGQSPTIHGRFEMPALDNADMMAILGDDYLAKKDELERASGLGAEERDAKARLESLNNQKVPALCGAFLGALLIFATKWSPTALAASNQTMFGGGLVLFSLAAYFWLTYEVKKGRG